MSGNNKSTSQLGKDAEDQALAFLLRQGLKLLERNYRCRLGEIDLIMQDGKMLVFVEVRKRTIGHFGNAAESITPAKQARLVSAAQFYLMKKDKMPACRFDAIAIDGTEISWIRNVIETT